MGQKTKDLRRREKKSGFARQLFFVKIGKRTTFSYQNARSGWLEEAFDDAFPAWELIYDGKRISVNNPPDSNLLKNTVGWV